MSVRTALITGVTGQDGSYLAELLLARGYRVCGTVRAEGTTSPHLDRLRGGVELFPTDLLDPAALATLLDRVRPDEIYNLAAMTFVPTSWQHPASVMEFTALSVGRLLEAMRQVCPQARLFQAGSSEMFGTVDRAPQNETTPFRPRSPYGTAKVCAHVWLTGYRACYGLFACSGILFNHESPRRGPEFVTRKITCAVARIQLGLDSELRLGNLQAQRDWGHAADYVRAMWLMLQQDRPDDYVIGTGELHTVEEFVATAFGHAGLDWRKYVVVDRQFYRPLEPVPLVADASRAAQQLGWRPEIPFAALVAEMVDADQGCFPGLFPG